MPNRWSHLNNLQVGRYAEYFVKMRFVQQGFDVYSAEVDNRGIDFVLRKGPDRYWNVQVKSLRGTGYVFFQKSKFRIRPNLVVALVIFLEKREPELFLIPSAEWLHPGGILVDREYSGLKSAPEYGINISNKGLKALEPFRFAPMLEHIFSDVIAGQVLLQEEAR